MGTVASANLGGELVDLDDEGGSSQTSRSTSSSCTSLKSSSASSSRLWSWVSCQRGPPEPAVGSGLFWGGSGKTGEEAVGDDERQGGGGDAEVLEQEAVVLIDEGANGDPNIVRGEWGAVVAVSKMEGTCEFQGGGWCAFRGLEPQSRDHCVVSGVCWQREEGFSGRGHGHMCGRPHSSLIE